MVKRIIFDLDNTLIMWKDAYLEALKKTIDYYKLNIDYIELNNYIEQYENYYLNYDKEKMLLFLSKKINQKLSMDFLDMWLYELGYMADYDKDISDTLEYLSKKYELVVLTNWFKDSQVERLKTAKIEKYFKEIYAGEEVIKPSKESFLMAASDKKIDECIMIGDSLKIDVEGALEVGMKAILLDQNDEYNYEPKIKKIKDLKEIL